MRRAFDSLLLLCPLVKERRSTKEADGALDLANERVFTLWLLLFWFDFFSRCLLVGKAGHFAIWIKVSLGKG